jgi:hypothetical protein
MTIKKISVAKVAEYVAKAIEGGDVAELEKLGRELIELRRAAFGGPAASARPALYELIGQVGEALRRADEKADEDRVDVLTGRIDSQIAAARSVLEQSGDPRLRLEALRAHLRVAWAARSELGGPTADPRLRAALARLISRQHGKDERAKFFSELEHEFKEFDAALEALQAEVRRLNVVSESTKRLIPKGNPSLLVGRGVVLV